MHHLRVVREQDDRRRLDRDLRRIIDAQTLAFIRWRRVNGDGVGYNVVKQMRLNPERMLLGHVDDDRQQFMQPLLRQGREKKIGAYVMNRK